MLQKEYNFSEFGKITKKEWLEKASLELKGKPLESLNWKIGDMEYTPFFTKEDLSKIPLLSPESIKPWLNLQQFVASNNAFESGSIEALNNGADGLIIEVTQEDNLLEKLDTILPEYCHLSISTKSNCLEITQSYFTYLNNCSVDYEKVQGYGMWCEIVTIDLDQKQFNLNSELLVEIVKSNRCDNFRNILIDTELFSKVNCSPSNEIGFSLSLLVYVINDLLSKGLKFEEIASNIFFRLKSKTQYFVEIAKIRALRILVGQIFNQYSKTTGITPKIHIDVDSEDENMLLKNTTQAMSSVIGGADSITVICNGNKSQDIRIARNVSNIIKEESYFDKSQDPAAGSFFIESLTHDIAKKAWNVFMDIERSGGFADVVQKDFFNQLISKEINQGGK